MILQALYQLAQDERLVADPDYERKPVAWLVVVNEAGHLVRIIGTRTESENGRKDRGKVFRIARQLPSRSGTKPPPEFFADNAAFVLGLGTKDKLVQTVKDRAKAEARRNSFRGAVAQCAAATGDEAARAVLSFLDAVCAGDIKIELDPETQSNDLFAFVYGPDEDRLVTDRPKIERYWRGIRQRESGEPPRLCLVSGRVASPADKHKLLKHLPGATSTGAALVSFNSNAFESYGWKRHENAAVSVEAAEACGAAINRLLDPAYPDPGQPGQTLPRRHVRLSPDTVVCYWTAGNRASAFCSVFGALLDANPEQVGELYRSIWNGREPDLRDATPFYALTLSGAQGRAAVRDWIESTVERVGGNLARHFEDITIRRNTPRPKARDLPPQISLAALLGATVADGSAAPGPLVRQVVESVFAGSVYPISLLHQAILRERAEIGRRSWQDHVRRDARAAIIKAVLNRRKRFHQETTDYKEIGVDMDPNSSSEGYALGRLIAVLERIQQEALGNVNATLIDRYFSGASATPKGVFVRLLRNARHHVSKARDDPQRGGIVFRLDRLVDELAGRFSPTRNGFPAHLDLEQQGLFILGYHQMRHWLWMNTGEREEWEQQHQDAPRAYLSKAATKSAAAE
jgi:CRISPR-associated protein Csd1